MRRIWVTAPGDRSAAALPLLVFLPPGLLQGPAVQGVSSAPALTGKTPSGWKFRLKRQDFPCYFGKDGSLWTFFVTICPFHGGQLSRFPPLGDMDIHSHSDSRPILVYPDSKASMFRINALANVQICLFHWQYYTFPGEEIISTSVFHITLSTTPCLLHVLHRFIDIKIIFIPLTSPLKCLLSRTGLQLSAGISLS